MRHAPKHARQLRDANCAGSQQQRVVAAKPDDRALDAEIAGAAIAAVIVVIALLLLIVGIPSSFMTSAIQERIERETGYKLAINGATRIGIWPSLNVTMKDVTLQDPKDRDITNRLTAASIEAELTLSSVWSGKPEITELVIVRPIVNLPLQRERVRDANAARTAGGATAHQIPKLSVLSAFSAALNKTHWRSAGRCAGNVATKLTKGNPRSFASFA